MGDVSERFSPPGPCPLCRFCFYRGGTASSHHPRTKGNLPLRLAEPQITLGYSLLRFERNGGSKLGVAPDTQNHPGRKGVKNKVNRRFPGFLEPKL
jgi:hypothetical protein